METLRWILTAILAVQYVRLVPAFTSDLETRLRSQLLVASNYNYLVRPNDLVNVTISFSIISLNSLDIKTQTMDAAGYLDVMWEDPRLDWSGLPAYSNLSAIYVHDGLVWTPPIVIVNSVNNMFVIRDGVSPIRVTRNGSLRWLPPKDFVLHCETDPTYYPFDTHSCPIAFTTWAYISDEVTMRAPSDTFYSTIFYHQNGEWEYISAKTFTSTVIRGGEDSHVVVIEPKFRRRPLFYILNTLIPITLLAMLSGFIFKLTPESGEKMGFVLTVLLAYAVYLTLVDSIVPTTSVHMSILSLLLLLILMCSVVSVIITIYVLHIHSQPGDVDISPRMRNLIRFIAVCGCWKGPNCCKSQENKADIAQEAYHLRNTETTDGNLHPEPQLEDASRKPETEVYVGDSLTWQEVALIIDNFCFKLYFVLVSLVCMTCVAVMLYGYYYRK